MKRYIKNIIPAAALALTFGMTSCTGDLDVEPIDPNLSLNYDIQGLFNKCYANIALAGNGGANGDCDIDGLDGGTTGFVRQMWNSREGQMWYIFEVWYRKNNVQRSSVEIENDPQLKPVSARFRTGDLSRVRRT